MILTARTLSDAMRIGEQAAELWVDHVNAALKRCGCETREQVAQWIAQVGHESEGLSKLVESMNYSAERLMVVFGRYYPLSAAEIGAGEKVSALARLHGRTSGKPADERAIANHVYNGRNGNRPGTDDGWNYRAHGPIGVTGLSNYRECGDAIDVDLVADPSLLELRATGAASTAWFWRKHDLAQYGGDVLTVTRKINGGTNGIDDRRARYVRALAVLGGGELRRVS